MDGPTFDNSINKIYTNSSFTAKFKFNFVTLLLDLPNSQDWDCMKDIEAWPTYLFLKTHFSLSSKACYSMIYFYIVLKVLLKQITENKTFA